MAKLILVPENAVYSHLQTDEPWVLADLRDRLTFMVPGAQFQPQFKKGHWDGKIRLVNKHRVYSGLSSMISQYCRERAIEFEDHSLQGAEASPEALQSLVRSANLAGGYIPRDYQLTALSEAFKARRALFVSPTASGKSLIIYLLIHALDPGPTLIIVPLSSLVYQMAGDFKDYGFDVENLVHTISGGERATHKPVVISTWQSIVDQPQSYFDRFRNVIGDEAHLFKAASLKSIMERLVNATWRFGFTGTLSGSKTHAMVLEGLFGRVIKLTTTRDLQDQGFVAQTKIAVIVFKHPQHARVRRSYTEEIEHLISCKARNEYLVNLAFSLPGNTLLLFSRIDTHGRHLYDMLLERQKGRWRELFYFHGGVSGEKRNEGRLEFEQCDDAIALASYGVFSTGMNVKRIHNLILGSPWKSRILNLQSLGRGLRIAKDKQSLNVFDLGDDLSVGSYQNHTLKHLNERIRIYCSEMLEDYRVIPVDLTY